MDWKQALEQDHEHARRTLRDSWKTFWEQELATIWEYQARPGYYSLMVKDGLHKQNCTEEQITAALHFYGIDPHTGWQTPKRQQWPLLHATVSEVSPLQIEGAM